MSILSTVKTVFKADVSDHRRKVKQLRDDEKKAAQERLRELEDQNAGLEKNIATLGKVAVGVAAVGAAYVAARESFQEFAKRTQLETAAAGINIEALQRSSRGLLTEMQLLELAAKAQGSAFGATQDELKEVAEMYTVLISRGHDSAEVFDELTKAIVEGNAEGLKKFGVQIRTQSDTVQGFNDILGEFRRQTEAAGDAFPIAGESIKRATVEMDDAFSELKTSVGRLVEKLSPAITTLARFIAKMTDALGLVVAQVEIQGPVKDSGRGFWEIFTDAGKQKLANDAVAQLRTDMKRREQEQRQRFRDAQRAGRKAGGAGGGFSIGESGVASSFQSFGAVDPAHAAGFAGLLGQSPGQVGAFDFTGGSFAQDEGPTALQRVFGRLEEFEAYTGAFAALQGASQSAFASWVDGSKSAGDAVKAMFGEMIRSVAADMFARSLQHAAAAVGSLALGDVRGAATHGKAAGLYAAGAVVVGGIARNMSGGGAATGSGATSSIGATPPAVSPTATAQGGGTHVTAYIGSTFASNDQRQEQQRIKRTLIDAGMANDGAVIFA